MNRQTTCRTSAVALLLLAVASSIGAAAEASRLWQIGKPDNDDREFALAPNQYGQFRDDGFFVIGRSEPRSDWPYVHPGPADAWAGSRKHTFAILFGLKAAPSDGQCRLTLDLIDTHQPRPPELQITVNGTQQVFRQRMPRGAGDASVGGAPEKGREHRLTIMFPAKLLRAGANTIAITNRSGSWALYDWLGLDTPAGLELADVTGTTVTSVESPPALVRRDQQLMQAVRVSIRHAGPAVDAQVRVGDVGATQARLHNGSNRVELVVPAVTKATSLAVSVDVQGKTIHRQDVTLKPVRQWVVYLLPHSHVDIGYTHVQTEVERAQWDYLEMAIDTAKKTAGNPPGSRFKWNVEVLWAVDGYLKQATPEKRKAFVEAVRAGMVGLDALYGNMLTGLCSQEELLRAMHCAQRMTQLTGVPIESAMITDVPGYTWGMVPAFAQNGVKYFSVGPNGGDRIGNTSKAWGDKPFWWLGPNGRDKVLFWMTGTGYYRVFQTPETLHSYLERLDERGYPYDFVQVRHCLGDNGAPDVGFADTVKQWNDRYAYPRLVIATTAEMFRDFAKRYGDQLPTAKGDFTPYWEDGAGSSARETALNRASAERLVQAETLFALLQRKAYPAARFDQAWRNVILYDEHTWGAHNSISQPDAPFVKQQWAIKQGFALAGDRQSRTLLDAANASRGAPVTPPSRDMTAIDVVNTTSFSYPHALVVVPKQLSQAGDAVNSSPERTRRHVTQRLTSGELVFRACWPSYMARRLYVTSDPPRKASFAGVTVEGNTLTASRSSVARQLTVRLDETTGAIASLRYGNRELVDAQAATAVNDYFYLPGSDLKGLRRNGRVKISIKERGPLIASLLVESDAPGCRKLTREVRVHALRNYVEIINTVDKLPVRTKEGIHFGFGFHVPDGVVHIDVPWGVVRPDQDQLPGACRNWFSVQRWVDVANKDYGVTWITPDAPLLEIGSITANLIGGLAGSPQWREQLDPSTTIYSWAMNNHWHTNYRAEQEGPTQFRYIIWPHHGGFHAGTATRRALECTQPLLVMPARGELPGKPLLRVRGKYGVRDIEVSALKPSEDGQAWIVRLFCVSNQDEEVTLEWSGQEPKTVWLSDNSERPRSKVTGPIPVPAWSIVTLRVANEE